MGIELRPDLPNRVITAAVGLGKIFERMQLLCFNATWFINLYILRVINLCFFLDNRIHLVKFIEYILLLLS